jgi:molybdopterin converting factor small subunit
MQAGTQLDSGTKDGPGFSLPEILPLWYHPRAMKIKITFQGPVLIEGVNNGNFLAIEEGTTLTDLMNRCSVKKEFHMFIVTLVNGKSQDPAYLLQDQDEVTLFMPVSGG